MVFGFFKKKEAAPEEPEFEPVTFQGPVSGKEVNLKANGRLVEAGLMRAKHLVSDALSRRCDSIRVDPKGPQAVVTLYVDGVPYPGGKLAKAEGLAITQMLKLLAGLDVKERTKPQSSGINAEFDRRKYRLGINSIPVADGERLVVRIVDLKIKLETPADVGMGEPLRLRLREVCTEKGVLAVVGPPGSGTTSTLAAVVRNVDSYIYTIYTIGDHASKNLPHVTAHDVNPDDDLETTITRAVRKEANVILCEPLSGAEMAKALFARHEDVLLVTEFPAKDAPSAVHQLIEWVSDPQLVSAGLRGIVTQKLIRKLCNDCRQAYRPKPDFLKKLGLPAEMTVLYRKPPETNDPNVQPCETCGGVGYFGRTAMFEFLDPSDEMRQLIAKKADASAIRAQMRKDKLTTLQQDGLRLVVEGKTSLEELQRIFKPAGS